jgi:hypothetical protein
LLAPEWRYSVQYQRHVAASGSRKVSGGPV